MTAAMTTITLTLTDDDAALCVAALLAHAMDLRGAARRHGWHPNSWRCDPDQPCQSCRRRDDLTARADRCQAIISLIEMEKPWPAH